MTAPDMTTDCPDEETLAALVDGRLDGNARSQVLRHLDRCEECRDAILLVGEVAVEEASEGKVVQGSFGKPAWLSLAAAAAVLVLLLAIPAWQWMHRGGDVERIADATKDLHYRPSEARLSGDYPYQEVERRMRGGETPPPEQLPQTEASSNVKFLNTAAPLLEKRGDSVDHLRAMAAADLYLGLKSEALARLDEARKRADTEHIAPKDRAALLNDFAVAQFELDHLAEALKSADEARSLDPHSAPAAWTRAMILQRMDRKKDAVQAWQEYLRIDPNSPWSEEARKHLTDLNE